MIDYYDPNSSDQEHFLFIFPSGEVKLILHIRDSECEGIIKSLLEKGSLWENVCASAQFWLQRKEVKKQETRQNQIINSISTRLIPSYCYHIVITISKPKIKPKTITRSTKISTRAENTSPLLPFATGVLPPICIYCNRRRKNISWKDPVKNEKHETEIAIWNNAKIQNDESMILKIGNYIFGQALNFVAKEVHHYYECKKNYLHKKR